MTKKRSINIPKGTDQTGYIPVDNIKQNSNNNSFYRPNYRQYSYKNNSRNFKNSNVDSYNQYRQNAKSYYNNSNPNTYNPSENAGQKTQLNQFPSYNQYQSSRMNQTYNPKVSTTNGSDSAQPRSYNHTYNDGVHSDVWAHEPGSSINSPQRVPQHTYSNNNFASQDVGYQNPYANCYVDTAADKHPTYRHSGLKTALSIITIFAIIFAAAWCLREFVFQAYEIPSSSMEQTIMTGDMVFAEKVSHYFSEPERGDIVTFDDPEVSGRILIKRVIAKAGQTVNIKNSKLYIDNVEIDEPYINGAPTKPLSNSKITYPYTIPDGCIWVMGDNRTNSQDSRYYGAVPLSNVIGRALAVYWPTYDAKIFD